MQNAELQFTSTVVQLNSNPSGSTVSPKTNTLNPEKFLGQLCRNQNNGISAVLHFD